MPVTLLDIIVVVVVLLSAFLATIRGFSREILSLLSWVLAAAATFFLYEYALQFASPYFSNKTVAIAVTIVVLFLFFLFVISIFTMKLADIIVDSRIGALDRTLGFIFGLARGVLILAVAVIFLNELVKPADQVDWIKNAKTKPAIDSVAYKLRDTLNEASVKLWGMADRIKPSTETSPNDLLNNGEAGQPVE
ncbi:CvpA family protein [Bartonella sp. HY329]|uniref:CvpA family protein n=1 Tax=unclassified Bartonella TaxID=2645622 RepID=UPI0021C8DC5E|nr:MULTISPECIES: CvpA family protein [unclassified Bartonella]UXM94209.1 CvpA family protein [Bartonella sp. HY329]UXN08531.1 CvpA family protein [Bartonella sp. HY328]